MRIFVINSDLRKKIDETQKQINDFQKKIGELDKSKKPQVKDERVRDVVNTPWAANFHGVVFKLSKYNSLNLL